MFDKMNKEIRPTKDELVGVIEGSNNMLLRDVCAFIEAEFNPKEQIDYSICSGEPGWNLKYKKSSKSICTIYPNKESFTILITLNFDALEMFNTLADGFSQYMRELVVSAGGLNGSKWLMIEVTNRIIAEDAKKLIKMKANIKKK